MQFEEFVTLVDAAVRDGAHVGRCDAHERDAVWSSGARTASIALVPPLNVSVALAGPAQRADTTWYPIDAALVPVVSRRIASFLREA